MTDAITRGGIFAARLNPVEGSEQAGTRPVLVVSNDAFNAVMPVITIVPLTTRRAGRAAYPSEIPIAKGTAGLRVESLALCHQVRTIATARLGRQLGIVDPETLSATAAALRIHLAL